MVYRRFSITTGMVQLDCRNMVPWEDAKWMGAGCQSLRSCKSSSYASAWSHVR